MRKIFLIAFLLTSVAGLSQTAQFGDWYFRQRIGINKPTNNLHPNSVFEVNDSSIGSLFRIYKNGGIQSFKFKNNSAEDSILTTDQFGNFKLRLKPSTVLPWDSITGKPSLLISGNNLADVSNVATARTNLSVYSIATVNDSLLNHYTKSQADARFKSIDWFPSVANVTGLPDSLTNLQARIQTKLTKSDADTYYPSIQRMQDSLAAVQARVQTKEPFISPGTSAQYWRGDKSWQTLDKSAVGLSAVSNVDATNPANISQSATYRFVTDSEKSTWNAKQNALGYTPENTANKATDFSTVNNTLYPTVQAVSNAITSATSSYIPLSQKGANNGVATLDVGGKVPFSQLPAALMIYKGTWNVSTNTPTLADGTGVTGWVYIVSVGGTINTGSGNITYSAGDYAIHNGSTWEKSAGTNNVASVNGQQGVVNLTTANISESGNLYYTDARTRAALSFTPGSGAYNSSTGVITIPTNTNQLTNGAGFITGFTETDPTIYAWAKAATKPSYSWTEIGSRPTALSQFTNDLIYSWALQGTKPSYTYGEIGGTVPTWNQNTTGNAATSSLSANSTLWNGLAIALSTYTTGTVPSALIYNSTNNRIEFGTWAQYQSWLGLGSAAYTASSSYYSAGSTVANSTLWGGLSFSDVNLTTPSYVLSSTGGGEYKYSTIAQIMSSAGLGSYAYRSSGLAELSGANFTGDITGTNATYNGNVTLQVGANRYIQIGSATSYYWRLKSVNENFLINMGADALTAAQFIYPTGAVEFYGGITNTNSNSYIKSVSTVAANDAILSAQWGDGNGMHIKYNPSYAVGYIQNSYPVSTGQPYGDIHIRQNIAGAMTTRMFFKGETGFIGINSIAPDAPLHINGGPSMTGGWNRTLTLQSTFPSIVFNSANNSYAGISYDYSSNMVFRVGASTNDIYSTGITALTFNSGSGAANFGSSVTANGINANSGWNITLSGGDVYFNNNGGYGLLSQNANRQLAITNSGITIPVHLSMGNRAGLTPSIMGYSNSYKTLIVGSIGSNYLSDATSLAFNVDLSGNPSGSFTGNGFEYFWRNTGEFRTPNAANNGFNVLYSWNSSGEINIPNPINLGTTTVNGIATVTNYVTAPNFYTNSGGYYRVSGGSGVYWEDYQTRLISTSQYYTQSWSDNGIIIANRSGTAKGYVYHDGSGFGLLHSAGGWGLRLNNGTSGGDLYGSWTVGNITATNLIRSGGTSSQFLKADGSVDANTYATTASLSSYATTASLSGYVNTSTNQLEISGNKSFLGAVEVLSIKTTGGPGTPGVLKFGTKTNDTVFTGGSAYSIPVNIDGTTYYIRLWAGIN